MQILILMKISKNFMNGIIQSRQMIQENLLNKAKNIRLSCNLNGNDSCVVEFNSSELTRVVVERVFMYQKFRPQSDILCICNNRKINLDKTLEENGLEDQNHITIISSNSPFSSI